ncbi:phage integrase [Paraglaciecola sp. T6c]|uniref:site-specific integrase n=1 Tax=Pseudoalteromonas atlantica (strain T6c / ATCC BAA-1087) TaxID=3042615 RepID=UPI00005C5AA4|nr:site-specific integrase [Paraglaciecola sp. T6c]ABG40540.1 phage integrase [Paraglaciecola sp. T6c]
MKLVNFRIHDFSKNFLVVDGVMFNDLKWHIQWAQSEHLLLDFGRVKLESCSLTDHSELYRFAKMITYYCCPKKVNLNISSWNTTHSRFLSIINFIQDFIWPNQLLSAKMLSSVTEKQLKDHLNIIMQRLELGVSGSTQRYRFFVNALQDWSDFTRRKLLPKEYGLDVNIDNILTKDIRSKCNSLIENQSDTWQPLAPEVIELIYKDGCRYLYDFADTIIECQELIRNRPLVGTANRKYRGQIRSDGKSKELFKTLRDMKVPMLDTETKLFNFTPETKKVKSGGYICGWQLRTTINISEVRPEVINLKRACIVLIALFTGMRRREIAELKSTPAFKKNGDWYLAITRFKTSDDASGAGEPDEIPVPQIVCDAVNVLIRLFKANRQQMTSDYLLVADILTHKQYEKIKIQTVSKDIRKYISDVTGTDGHSHQLRKTLAWLLISRSEHNIELIRQLFGHKSFGMTLRYILRNELLVGSVMELIEHNYTEDLNDAFQSISDGKAAGNLFSQIKQRMEEQNYRGQVLAVDVESFIHEAIQAGVPMFISRLPIGAFCIKAGESEVVPPCMKRSDAKLPQIEFCDYKKCSHVLHNDESMANINSQISYYEQKQKYLPVDADKRVVSYYKNQVIEHQQLLDRLGKSLSNPVSEKYIDG